MNAVLSSIDTRPLVDRSTDPNLEILRWFWRMGPNPFLGPQHTVVFTSTFATRLVRISSPVTVYDSTRRTA